MICDDQEGICRFFINSISTTADFISTQLDVLYLGWVISLIYPTFLAILLLPFVIALLLYISSFLLYLYYHRHKIFLFLQESIEKRDPWVGGRYIVSFIWDAHGYIWHSYEISGLENVPNSGGGIIAYYHGALPIDIYYLTSRLVLRRGRLLYCIGDKFLNRIIGLRTLLEAFHINPGSVSSCVEDVNNGNIIVISPGGVREALFSDHTYQLIWGKRTGFAKVALKTKCPIIPMFTENVRESFRNFIWPQWLWWRIYNRFKLPCTIIYGGFPVKLRTHLGEPIWPTEDETPEELAQRVNDAVKNLIHKHQKIPGNIFRALLARFYEAKREHQD